MGKTPTQRGSFQRVLEFRSTQVWVAAQSSTTNRISTRIFRHTMIGNRPDRPLGLKASGRPRPRVHKCTLLQGFVCPRAGPPGQRSCPTGTVVNPRLTLDPQL